MSNPTVTITAENGEELRLPAHFEVCYRCGGTGIHVNPSIDGHGLTAEDFAEDPDFAEAYMRGVYDVTCEECGGDKVVATVTVEALTPEQRAAWQHHLAVELDDNSERWLRYAESGVMG